VEGCAQVRRQEAHGFQRLRIAVEAGLAADIGLDGVGQRVDAGVGGDPRRQREGQLVVDERGDGHEAEARAEHFLVAGLVGDDGETRRLRAGAGGGGDGDQRQAGFADIAREAVVAHLAAELAEDTYGLGRIDRAAAAEGDDGIEIALADHFDAGANGGSRRLGQGIGEALAGDAGLFQLTGDARDIAELDHHAVGDDQRATAAQFLQYAGELPAGASADFHQARQNDAMTHRGPPRSRGRTLRSYSETQSIDVTGRA